MSYGGYQDQGNPYGNPYGSASNTEAGYGRGQQQEQHELQPYQPGQYESYGQQQSHNNAPAASGNYGDYSAPDTPAGHGVGGGGSDFFSRRDAITDELKALKGQIDHIALQQGKVFGETDYSRREQQLDGLVQQLRLTLTHIGGELRELKSMARNQAEMKHVAVLRDSFKEITTRWQQQDSAYRQRQASEIARQARIVNPDASDDEIRSIVERGNEGGLFQQALLTQNKAGQARAVLGNVQARHNEIMRIEQTMMELANMFQDLDTLVIQQDAAIQSAERQTEQTNENIGKGTEEVDKGIIHARRARRNKWICLGIVILIILIAVAIGVGVGLTQRSTTKG